MYVACGLQAEGEACVPKWVYNVNDVIDQIKKKKKVITITALFLVLI